METAELKPCRSVSYISISMSNYSSQQHYFIYLKRIQTMTHRFHGGFLHRLLNFPKGASAQGLHHLVPVLQVVLVLVLLHLHGRLGVWASPSPVRAAGRPAVHLAPPDAGCRVLQTSELGAAAGARCASAVRLASAHPPVRPARHLVRSSPEGALWGEQRFEMPM